VTAGSSPPRVVGHDPAVALVDPSSPSGYAQVIEERASGLLVTSCVYGSGLDPLSVTKNLDGAAGLLPLHGLW
jgi:hypothetical protein